MILSKDNNIIRLFYMNSELASLEVEEVIRTVMEPFLIKRRRYFEYIRCRCKTRQKYLAIRPKLTVFMGKLSVIS